MGGSTASTPASGVVTGANQKPGPAEGQQDRQFWIAVLFVLGFFVFLALAFADFVRSRDQAGLTFVGTLFGGWVGVIIGFYFGQKPVEQVKASLATEQKRTDNLQAWLQAKTDQFLTGIQLPPSGGGPTPGPVSGAQTPPNPPGGGP